MNMKELRERKKLKVIEVAYHLGVTEASVRNWEHARSVPTLTFEQTNALARLYGCTLDDLENAYKATASQCV